MSALLSLNNFMNSFFPTPFAPSGTEVINFEDPLFIASVAFAFVNPIAWNVLGRLEYNTGALSRAFSGDKRRACHVFAVFIFTLGIIRDFM